MRGGGRVSGVRLSVENDLIREIPEVSQRSRQGSVGVHTVVVAATVVTTINKDNSTLFSILPLIKYHTQNMYLLQDLFSAFIR